MANVVVNIPDDIYTSSLINSAKGKKCNICDKYIAEDEAESKDFHHAKTKRRADVFVHKHCWNNTYK